MLTRRQSLAGIASSTLLAAAPAPYAFPAAAARREDAAVLIRTYDVLHPGLTRYLAPAARAAVEARFRREADAALWTAAVDGPAPGSASCHRTQGKARDAAVLSQ